MKADDRQVRSAPTAIGTAAGVTYVGTDHATTVVATSVGTSGTHAGTDVGTAVVSAHGPADPAPTTSAAAHGLAGDPQAAS